MPRPETNPKQLIVEGHEDRHSVIGVMRAHIAWSAEPDEYPVYICIEGGVEGILSSGLISLKLRERLTTTLGVMLDADENPAGRYTRIRSQCLINFPNMPQDLPPGGLIINNGNKRFGVWIMPDNTTAGTLEIFLRHLVPADAERIWSHAVTSTESAKQLGAPYRDCHCPKANLYTWLAWQDEPAQRAGEALTKRILDPHAPSATNFVRWFRDLYQL